MPVIFKTRSAEETKKLAAHLGRKIAAMPRKKAIVIALSGNLGAGKTTFIQEFARALGVREAVRSPTFVLMKRYSLKNLRSNLQSPTSNRQLFHIDCYRLDASKDLLALGFKDLLKDDRAIIVIEWADRVKKLIPKNAFWMTLTHGKKPTHRLISLTAA